MVIHSNSVNIIIVTLNLLAKKACGGLVGGPETDIKLPCMEKVVQINPGMLYTRGWVVLILLKVRVKLYSLNGHIFTDL